MIGSVTEQRAELLALDERRRQIAAEAAQPPAPTVAVLMSGAAVPPAGAVPMAAKRRKAKERGKERSPADTAAVAEGEGFRAAMDEQAAGDAAEAAKIAAGIVNEGPGHGVMPSQPSPADSFSRPYLTDGRAAPSPMHDGPRTSPMPDLIPGMVTPVTLPAAPSARNVPQHVAGQYAGGSPSEK